MAEPWRRCDMVNNSPDVACPPRQRLAAARQTGHSAPEQALLPESSRYRAQKPPTQFANLRQP